MSVNFVEMQLEEMSAGKRGLGMLPGALLVALWLVILVVTLVVRRASKNPPLLLQVLVLTFKASCCTTYVTQPSRKNLIFRRSLVFKVVWIGAGLRSSPHLHRILA